MGKNFALALQLPAYRIEQSAKKKQLHIKTEKITVAALGLIVLLIVGYLIQVNSFSTTGYKITHLENQISELNDQNKSLEIQTAQLQSIQRIQTDKDTINMVAVKSIGYIQTYAPLTQR